MSNLNYWIQNAPINKPKIGQKFLRHVVTNVTGMNQLSLEIENPVSTGHWFEKPENWISSIMVYPFSFQKLKNESKQLLNVATIQTKVECHNFTLQSYSGLYNLGQFHVISYYNNFADYNGYTEIRVFLPYLGYVELNTNEVMNKWLQFRLKIDVITGQGMYIIGVSDTSVAHVDSLFVSANEDKDVRIISLQTCQIGLQLPLATSNTMDVFRNIISGTLRTTANLGYTYMAISNGGMSNTTSKVKKINKNKINRKPNNKTGSMDLKSRTHWGGSEKEITTSDPSKMLQYHAQAQAIDSSIDSLTQFHINGSCDKPTNASLIDSVTPNIKVIIKRPIITPIDNEYNHIYGLPVGKVDILENYKGFTKVTDAHLEGSYYSRMNTNEKDMLDDILKEGIIL